MNKTHNINNSTWSDFKLAIPNNLLTKAFIADTLSRFIEYLNTTYNSDTITVSHLNVLFTVQYTGEVYKTFGRASKINITDPGDSIGLIRIIQSWYAFKLEQYKGLTPEFVVVKYRLISPKDLLNTTTILHAPFDGGQIDPFTRSKEAVYESSRSIAGLDLPYSMNILKWGKIISMQDDTFRISYKSEEGSSYILVVNCLTQTHHLVEVLLEDGRSINLTFEDTYRVRTSHPVSSPFQYWTLRLLSSGRVRTARMEWMVYSAELNEKDR